MFGISDHGAFCAAILIFLALPGPGTLALLTATGQGGMRAGAATTLGLIVGDQVLLWMAVGGVAALLATHPTAFTVVQSGGALYLGYLGVRLLFSGDGSASPLSMAPGHYARQGLLITVLNPKAIVFYMAFFPLFINPATHQGTRTFVAMALTIAAITAAYCLTLCAVAHHVAQRFATRPALGRWLKRGAGACLIGFGIKLLAR